MPFHNIFRKTTFKKPKQPITIIADIHEKNSLLISELHNNPQIQLEIRSLKIGDYLIGKTIIERKTTSDFINSMINKRLIQQLNQMQAYPRQLLIIEGDFETPHQKGNINPNAIRGFILSILTHHQIPLIFTKDYKDTSDYLIILAKQQLKPQTPVTLHHRIPKTIPEQKQYILESFPNIGPTKAKKLLEKFKTLKNTINAQEEELKEILMSKSKDFKNLLNS